MIEALNEINLPLDIKNKNINELCILAEEIRKFLIKNVSETGGHLASNLGTVELTIALHYCFNTPEDKIVWDVGHQAYVHKIITGRKDAFNTLRKLGGISGFPKTSESLHDCFNTGHSSTSISAALGFARARDLKKEQSSVIAVIGDGALTGGMAFEALNDAGRSHNNMIVILNDNEMSISKNVGGMSCYLSKIRTEPIYFKVREDIDVILKKIPAIGKSAAAALDKVKGSIKYMIMPGALFEELGFKYIGPIDGHDISEIIRVLTAAKSIKGPILIHAYTQKGKGYTYAEESPHLFHGIAPFEIETGELKSSGGKSFTEIFRDELVSLASKNENIAAVSAAMPIGTGLDLFGSNFPNRFFDVGIAEQHAVTMAAGLAMEGIIPVVAIYSTFLQRAYDQILHDVALQNLHVVFAIDRAGIVGEDGETHQGIYDLSFLRHIPNITILAPSDYKELTEMLHYAVLEHNGPIAIRYPRGRGVDQISDHTSLEYSKGEILKEGTDLTIAAIGSMVQEALKVAERLSEKGISARVINARFVKPLDEELLLNSAKNIKLFCTMEENVILGGFGSSVLELFSKTGINIKTKMFGIPDEPIVHGSRSELLKKYKIDCESIAEEIEKDYHG